MLAPIAMKARCLFATAAITAIVAACSSTPSEPSPETVPCSSAAIAQSMDRMEGAAVFVDDAVPEQVRADLRDYLSRLWKTPIAVTVGPPSGSAIWISSSADAKARARGSDAGYAIVRDGTTIIVHADAVADLTAGAYALLEELGIRFFHPMQELVPELDGVHFPRALDVHRRAAFATRGLQVHTLHPLEYLDTLNAPSEKSFDEARRLVDWLVKTGQNHLQWPLLGPQVPWPQFAEHARRIAAYAHGRGVTVGAVVQMHQKAALQRNYVLVTDEAQYEAQIRAGLTQLMEVPWDDVELALGEFLTADPEALLVWLEIARLHIESIAPGTNVAVQNHVGDYEHLYIDFRGRPRTYFYHVPRYADPRLGQTVHSLFFYDLYREGGMYEHENFFFQREFILEELATHGTARRVRYYPESAYWIAADVDVPIFLPEFIESRWTDIHNLARDIRDRGLPPLDGHVLFTSGHEWGYWITDYLAAKMAWEPDAPLDRFLTHYTSAYGSCAPEIGQAFSQLVALEREYFFEKRLIPYASGEDHAVDLGALAGFNIRPPRKKFDDLVTGPEADRAAFEASVLPELEAFVEKARPIEDAVAARCRGSDPVLAPWCNELRDGVRVTRMRIEHSILLYRAVLAYARADAGGAKDFLQRAMAKTEEAAEVIFEREKGYRFDVARLTDFYPNVTTYPFGYLRQAHTQCLWRRQDEQARRIIEEDLLNGGPSGLPTCLN